MAPRNDVEAVLAALNAAAELPPGEALPPLRKALAHRSNLIVSRAARHIARLDLRVLHPDLVTAFQRFMPEAGDPVKTDPQCWAKLDIAKALATFDAQEPALFLSGLKHIQLEPTWGGSSDTAGPLRGACALALVPCRELASPILLRHLTPLFADKELPVRINAARAVEQVGSDSSALILRFRAELGPASSQDDEPELLGACITGVLNLEGDPAVPWAAKFLDHPDTLAAEAAFALAQHRTPTALTHLQAAHATTRHRELRSTLLSAIATMRFPEATSWLLDIVSKGTLEATVAAKALCEANPSAETVAQLRALNFPCKKS